jgi:hypothetical protein
MVTIRRAAACGTAMHAAAPLTGNRW